MPTSKKPLIRYQVIDRCLRNTARKYGKTELMEVINDELVYRGLETIGKVTFYQDIKDMQNEFGAPIESYREGNRAYFQYSSPTYSFANQPLNQEEVDHIRDAVLIMSRFSGIPGLEWVDELLSKLELGTYQEVRDKKVIAFAANDYLIGREYIGPIFKSILQQQVLNITYQKFTDAAIKIHIVHPYYLKEYDNRWYLLCYLPARDRLMLLSIDRIRMLEINPREIYIPNERFDLADYFEDMIGVSRGEEEKEIEKVKLKFSPLMSNYVRTKPLHGSQKLVETFEDGSSIISIEVIINHELENLIFSYKSGVEVLSPDHLRSQIEQLYDDTINQYK
ncbi:MAG: putative DNA-binding transcriptional regulator YafY [Cyclobacteriaceae bacterium]|jgi:predicted DNA-binding transcriptional regulator YafY